MSAMNVLVSPAVISGPLNIRPGDQRRRVVVATADRVTLGIEQPLVFERVGELNGSSRKRATRAHQRSSSSAVSGYGLTSPTSLQARAVRLAGRGCGGCARLWWRCGVA
jgi:hypothetical protein